MKIVEYDIAQINAFLFLVLFGLIILSIIFAAIFGIPLPHLPYKRKKYITTLTEKRLFRSLERVLGSGYYIFPQVNLDKILAVKRTGGDFLYHFRKMNQKSVDFVICDSELSPILAIELDDRSHLRPKRMERDEFVNRAFRDAGMPLLRIKTSEMGNIQMIEEEIRKYTATEKIL